MQEKLLDLSEPKHYCLFRYFYKVLIEGKPFTLKYVNSELSKLSKIITDKEKSLPLTKYSPESAKFKHFHDYVGLLLYLKEDFQKSFEYFESGIKFKRNLLNNQLITKSEFDKAILISIYNEMELYMLFQIHKPQTLKKLLKDNKPEKVNTYEELAIFKLYYATANFICDDYKMALENISSIADDMQYKIEKFYEYLTYKKECLIVKIFEKTEVTKVLDKYMNLISMFKSQTLLPGESYIKCLLLKSDYEVIYNRATPSESEVINAKGSLQEALELLKQIEDSDVLTKEKIGKLKLVILNKIMYLDIYAKNFKEALKTSKELSKIFEIYKSIENINNFKLIYLNNKIVVEECMADKNQCLSTVNDLASTIVIDSGSPIRMFHIINNISSFSKINYMEDLKKKLLKMKKEDRDSLLNKFLPNMITFAPNVLEEHSDLFTSDLFIIKILSSPDNILSLKLTNYNEYLALCFIYNFIALQRTGTDVMLGILSNSLKRVPVGDLIELLSRNATESSEYLIAKDIDFFLDITYLTTEYFMESNKPLRSFEILKVGLEKAQKLSANEFTSKTNIKYADCLKLLGDSQFFLKDLEGSKTSYERAQKIYLQFRIEDKSSVIDSSIAVIYILLKSNLDEALERIEKAILYFGKFKETLPQLEKAKQVLDLIKKNQNRV